jgi:hypothetical protein
MKLRGSKKRVVHDSETSIGSNVVQELGVISNREVIVGRWSAKVHKMTGVFSLMVHDLHLQPASFDSFGLCCQFSF